MSCVFTAQESWHSNTMISTNQSKASIILDQLEWTRLILTEISQSPDVKVGEETSLRCEGDGSPEPQFEWQQKLEDGDTSMVMVRLRETVLNIRSV